MTDVKLSPLIAELATRFAYNSGEPSLAVEDLARYHEVLAHIDPAQRDSVATELIALANRLQREAGAQATIAVAQLLLLAGAVLVDLASASAVFEAAGVDTGKALDAIGAASELKPVSGNVASSNSLFSLRLKKQV